MTVQNTYDDDYYNFSQRFGSFSPRAGCISQRAGCISQRAGCISQRAGCKKTARCESRILANQIASFSWMKNNKDLLTECEVCTGKYCLRFSYRPSDEGARSVR